MNQHYETYTLATCYTKIPTNSMNDYHLYRYSSLLLSSLMTSSNSSRATGNSSSSNTLSVTAVLSMNTLSL